MILSVNRGFLAKISHFSKMFSLSNINSSSSTSSHVPTFTSFDDREENPLVYHFITTSPTILESASAAAPNVEQVPLPHCTITTIPYAWPQDFLVPSTHYTVLSSFLLLNRSLLSISPLGGSLVLFHRISLNLGESKIHFTQIVLKFFNK